jgi:hypothetical protein
MGRRSARVALLVAVVIGGLVASAPPADADDDGCRKDEEHCKRKRDDKGKDAQQDTTPQPTSATTDKLSGQPEASLTTSSVTRSPMSKAAEASPTSTTTTTGRPAPGTAISGSPRTDTTGTGVASDVTGSATATVSSEPGSSAQPDSNEPMDIPDWSSPDVLASGPTETRTIPSGADSRVARWLWILAGSVALAALLVHLNMHQLRRHLNPYDVGRPSRIVVWGLVGLTAAAAVGHVWESHGPLAGLAMLWLTPPALFVAAICMSYLTPPSQ